MAGLIGRGGLDMATTLRWHGDNMTTTSRRHDGDMATTWQQHGDDMATMPATSPPHWLPQLPQEFLPTRPYWQKQGHLATDVAAMWWRCGGQCGSNVPAMWRQRGIVAMSPPCHFHVVIMSSSRRRDVVVTSSPCCCQVVGMSSPCPGHVVAMSSLVWLLRCLQFWGYSLTEACWALAN